VLALSLFLQVTQRRSVLLLATFALLMAAAFESSTWIGGIVFPLAASVSALVLLGKTPPPQRGAFVTGTAVAVIAAIALSAPLLHDQYLATAMRSGGSPIALRPYDVLGGGIPADWRAVLNLPAFWLVLMVVEFPATYITGAVMLWRFARASDVDADRRDAAILFGLLAIAGLAVSWLLVSTIGFNNDLGWRAVLPPAVVLGIFAAAGLSRWLAVRAWAPAVAAIVALLLGLPGGIALIRDDVTGELSASGEAFADTPALWEAVRLHAAPDERVGNDPLFLQDLTPWPVNLSWALLSNRRSCFAGKELVLAYTPLPQARRDEIDKQFIRVFRGDVQPNDVSELATVYDCRVIVVTPHDGAWEHDPFAASPLYHLVDTSQQWRIYRRAD
jgi:hypothetical protein